MKFIMLKYFSIFLTLLLIHSCKAQTEEQEKSEIWKSKYYDITIEFNIPWSQMPSIDSKEKSLFGVLDKNDGKSYVVKIVDDVSKDILSDSSYFEFTKKIMLDENEKNILLNETDTVIHGKNFHCLTFLMNTTKWGTMKQYGYIYRDGIKMISIQISFPIEEKNANQASIPEALIELDNGIKINGQ